MRRLVVFVLTLQLASLQLVAQTKTISGKILIAEPSYEKGVNSKFYSLPQATIFSKDTTKIGNTNNDGIFELQINDSIKTILAGFVGYDFELIDLSGNCQFYEIILIPDVIYDYVVTAKKAARLREKDRRILPTLYKEAFEQGLFKQNRPCSNQ